MTCCRDDIETFAWLDKAAAEKSGGLEVVKVVPAIDPWRSDPRYLDLVTRGLLWTTGHLTEDGKPAAGYEAAKK